jgi:glycosyltransferase involved in cell wall biosynthesis
VDPFYTPSEAVPRGGYFLSVHSNPKPHKGLADLLCAFDTVYERTGGATRLVLVGGGLTTVLRGPPPRGVTVEEGISKERLRELYRGADAVVVSSKGEGFCLPVVEAHGCGTPIISRPVAAVEELLTPGDVVTEDGSVGALAEALERWYRHCRESTFSEALAEETQRRFSQERVAALTWSVYTAALRSAPRGACTRSDGPPPDAVGNYR